MTSDQKRPPPTHGTRAAIMSPGLNAAAQSGSYGRGIRRGLPAVEVYRPSRFTGCSGLPASDLVSRSSRFTGHQGSPASDPIFRGNGYTSHPSGPSDLLYWDKGTAASKIHACEMHAYDIHISRDGRDSCE